VNTKAFMEKSTVSSVVRDKLTLLLLSALQLLSLRLSLHIRMHADDVRIY